MPYGVRMINKMYGNELEQIEQLQELFKSLVATSLASLSDAEYQKREWLKNDTSQVDCIEG